MTDLFSSFAVLPLIYVGKQIDFEEENNLLYLRIGYVAVQLITFLVLIMLKLKISSTNNTKKVMIKTPAGLGTPETEEEMTIIQYDNSELKKLFTQSLMQVVIIGVIHIKWESSFPLFIQIFMQPMRFFKHKLISIYFQGKEESRPFIESNPMADMMNKFQENKEEAEPTTPSKKKKSKKDQ